jgi:hypothetical protein
MAANVFVTGRHLIDDAHKRRGPDRKCRQNAGQLSVRRNKLNRVKEGSMKAHCLSIVNNYLTHSFRVKGEELRVK